MKAMVCEMCGSNEVVKQNGMYVCQSCNTKYSVEDAKKLFVTIDNTEKIKNLYMIARQAIKEGNNEKAAKYYDMIYMECPHDWEAAFYTVYCSAMQTTIGGINNAATKIAFCIPNVMQLIRDNVQGDSEQESAVLQVVYKVASGCLGMAQAQLSHYKQFATVDGTKKELEDTLSNLANVMFITGDVIEKIFPNNTDIIVNAACEMWDSGVNASYNNNDCLKYQAKIKKYNPNYLPSAGTASNSSLPNTSNSGGCYVATAVYGSYDCPEVWTLRRYRDYTLAETWHGRVFISLYYAISPTLVSWFGKTHWFKNMWKPKLDRLVKRLNREGIADTPYQDRQW